MISGLPICNGTAVTPTEAFGYIRAGLETGTRVEVIAPQTPEQLAEAIAEHVGLLALARSHQIADTDLYKKIASDTLEAALTDPNDPRVLVRFWTDSNDVTRAARIAMLAERYRAST